MAANPSRTTVDLGGSCWATNRDEGSDGKGSAVRVGITIGGVRHNKTGSSYLPDPFGEYLQNATYSTCVDRDGDGYIRTSTGLGNVLPWTNEAFNDTNGGVSTAADECIINYMRTAGTNARTVAVDKFNRVYIGGYSNYVHEMYDPALPQGTPVPNTRVQLSGCGGYGGFIDSQGFLWSARPGESTLRVNVLASEPNATATCFANMAGYGIAVDPVTGHIWQSDLGGADKIREFDVNGNELNSYPQFGGSQGIVVSTDGHVYFA